MKAGRWHASQAGRLSLTAVGSLWQKQAAASRASRRARESHTKRSRRPTVTLQLEVRRHPSIDHLPATDAATSGSNRLTPSIHRSRLARTPLKDTKVAVQRLTVRKRSCLSCSTCSSLLGSRHFAKMLFRSQCLDRRALTLGWKPSKIEGAPILSRYLSFGRLLRAKAALKNRPCKNKAAPSSVACLVSFCSLLAIDKGRLARSAECIASVDACQARLLRPR